MQHSDTSPWRCSFALHARFSTRLTVRFNWAQFSQHGNVTGCRVGIALLSPVPRVKISVQIIKFQLWPPLHWTALKAVGLLRWLLNRTAVIFLTLRADGEHYQMTTLLQGGRRRGHGAWRRAWCETQGRRRRCGAEAVLRGAAVGQGKLLAQVWISSKCH